jgi:Fe-S-cluster formation regulator IscX/YfhJ
MIITDEEIKQIIKEELSELVGKAQLDYEDEYDRLATDYIEMFDSLYGFKPNVDPRKNTIDDLRDKIEQVKAAYADIEYDKMSQMAKDNLPSSDDPEEMRAGGGTVVEQ